MHLGIDFGTSYTKISTRKSTVTGNMFSKSDMIPTVVSYAPSTGKLYYGDLALRLHEPGVETALFFKLALKRNPGMLLGPYCIENILEGYFKYLYKSILPSLEEEITSVTFTVPNYFGMNARQTMIRAAEKSFPASRIDLIPEPVAAALGCQDTIADKDKPYLEGEVLVIDIGGGTTDFSFVSFDRSRSRMLLETQLQMGHDAFSGSELDRGIVRYLLDPLYTIQSGLHLPVKLLEEKSLSPRDKHLLNSLLRLAETIKIDISNKDSVYFHIPDLPGGSSLSFTLTGDFFTTALQPVFDRLGRYIQGTITSQAEQLGLYQDGRWELNSILLLGGASKTRGVQHLVGSLFPGVKIITPVDADYTVVRGACLWPEYPGFDLQVKTLYPFSFYVETLDANGDSVLERIPFDTANLELDARGRYKIFSFAPDSPCNIHCNSGGLEVKIYEISDDNPAPHTGRFSGQELVFHVCFPAGDWPQQLHVYWDMARACLELDHQGPPPAAVDTAGVFTNWLEKQNQAFKLLDHYKFFHPGLREDFFDHLRQLEKNSHKPFEDHLDTTLFKLLSLLQIVSGK